SGFNRTSEYSMKRRSPMRTTILTASGVLIGACIAASADAQRGPRVSTHVSVSETVDCAALTISYGRLSMRGRTIFGALVPYGRVWCPGADEATTLDSSRPIVIGGLSIPTGPHTIWMLPTAGDWTLVVSKEPSGVHTRYNEPADLGRVPLIKRTLTAPVEFLTFAIEKHPSGDGGT